MDATRVANEGIEPKRSLELLDSNTGPPIALWLQTVKTPYIEGHTQDDGGKKQNGIETTL